MGPKKKKEEENKPLMNHKIQNLINGKNIVKYVKVQKLNWFSHIQKREQSALINLIANRRETDQENDERWE